MEEMHLRIVLVNVDDGAEKGGEGIEGVSGQLHVRGGAFGGVGQDHAHARLVRIEAAGGGVTGKIIDIQTKELQSGEHGCDCRAVNHDGIALTKKRRNGRPRSLLFGDVDKASVGPCEGHPFFQGEQRDEDLMADFLGRNI